MTIQPGAVLNTVAFGNRPEGVEVPKIARRIPTSSDWNYPLGKRWVDQVSGNEYTLASVTGSAGVNTATWTLLGSGGTLNTLTAGDATVVSPTSGNISFVDSTNVVSTAAGSDITFDLGTNPSISGSLTVGTDITSTAGNIVATVGNISADSGNITANTTVQAGTLLVSVGDAAGIVGGTSISNVNSTTISTGVGSVKMSTANAADNTAWIKIYIGATAYWIPAWTTNAP